MGIASKMAVSFILWYSCLSTYARFDVYEQNVSVQESWQ